MPSALGGSRGRGSQGSTLWVLLLLATAALSSRAAPTSEVAVEQPHLRVGVQGDMPALVVKATTANATPKEGSSSSSSSTPESTPTELPDVTGRPELDKKVPKTNIKPPAVFPSETGTTSSRTTKTTLMGNATTGKTPTTKIDSDDHLPLPPAVVQLMDLEHTEAPPMNSGHDGLKLTRKKQLQQQHFPTPATATTSPTVESKTRASKSTRATRTTRTTITTTTATTAIESEMERIPTTTSSSASSITAPQPPTPISSSGDDASSGTGHEPALVPVHNGYLGPIFMGEKTFSVVHPLKKPHPPNHLHVASIESQLRDGRIVEILAPTSLLEKNTEPANIGPSSTTETATPTLDPASISSISVLSTTVFQVPEIQTSTTRLPMPMSGGLELSGPAPPRTESKISDIQIEVYDSTVDSIVASTNFRDNEGYYPLPVEAESGTTRPPRPPVGPPQERFTQYVIDRADVSTQPASGGSLLGKPEPAAIEIHINVSEAFGSESEDLEFSYRQPQPQLKSSKPSDEILVVEIIDSANGDNSSSESSSSGEHINPIFTFRSDTAANPPPAVRPPQLQDADELFMADLKEGEGVPRPPPPPPPPPPRKPSIDRDSDTIFYISNTEVKVGESLPTGSPGSDQLQQQRKFQLENQFFPASYVMEQQQLQQQRSSLATPRYEEDIILSPVHNTADALKIFRSTGPSSGDGAPPLDVTYVGESVIEVEQQPQSASTTQAPLGGGSGSSPQSDIIIQPAVLPDLAIGVPVIGELPPQIELKEIDYMPGELGGMGIYENDIQSNSIGMGIGVDSDPDVIESSIQYGGDLIDDGAGGGFDGVEGSYPFESPSHRQLQDGDHPGRGQDHQPRHSAVSHLHREQPPMAELVNATLLQHNENVSVGGEAGSGSVSAMAPLLSSGAGSGQAMSNVTALSEDHLDDFDGYLNLFAVSMGLVIVILPSALLISMYCAIRYMLNKPAGKGLCGARSDDSEQGKDSKNESTLSATSSASSGSASAFASISNTATTSSCSYPRPSNSEKSSLGHQLGSGLENLEFRFEMPEIWGTMGSDEGGDWSNVIAPSGSVTKMTLKDNHLIVVTEERHDISRNARETKMHTDKDGVFVVEVARGIDSKQAADIPGAVPETTDLPFDTKLQQANGLQIVDEQTLPPSHEQVQIHAPPSDFANPIPAPSNPTVGVGVLHLIEEAEEQMLEDAARPHQEGAIAIAQTGLSQSDLSSTSSTDSNKRYSYGNQELYVIEQSGYATSSPTAQPILPSIKPKEHVEDDQGPIGGEQNDPTVVLDSQKPETKNDSEEQQTNEQNQPEKATDPEQKTDPELTTESKIDSEIKLSSGPIPELEMQGKPDPEMKTKPEPEKPSKPQFEINEEAKPEQEPEIVAEMDLEPENTYDSLMSLPAPPSTEEIKELNDFSLIESNQLDSLPPPPPPPLAEADTTNGKPKKEAEKEKDGTAFKSQAIISNGNGMVKVSSDNSGPEEPATLTPPASPPSPQSPTTGVIYGSNGLTNGLHTLAVVDVNGS
ncbi:uncharacterized protein [Drosophila pseudoobscura]|uniref:Uncharacterized protein isoform X1 n=1 Tax=Drosophila pseudoobscura pseudoobscura TaxID=46245 RepID=A0A6I8W632_DROPS|nr:uncharacterized protein LOC6901921 isoform X1 [Drosophila pseudoobscura]XP_033238810.1 uncharacterized protein LOC6901921 isoform X1 [Drosophila pseudoobscura]XP_033238811.1 uncharacterized protein LOC6901921 isoform X1 [Drosophila pseudoobscura]